MNLDELYQQVILDHSRRPRHHGPIENASASAQGDNPSCGDQITAHVRLRDQLVEAVGFEGSGCAISQAAASMLSLKINGQPLAAARSLLADYLKLVSGSPQEEAPSTNGIGLKHLGDLRLLSGVRKFPQRIKCATLAAHAYSAALDLAETASPSTQASA